MSDFRQTNGTITLADYRRMEAAGKITRPLTGSGPVKRKNPITASAPAEPVSPDRKVPGETR